MDEDISPEIYDIETCKPTTLERTAAKARARRITRRGANLSPDQIERLRVIFSSVDQKEGLK